MHAGTDIVLQAERMGSGERWVWKKVAVLFMDGRLSSFRGGLSCYQMWGQMKAPP
jgi:hypothetical protein